MSSVKPKPAATGFFQKLRYSFGWLWSGLKPTLKAVLERLGRFSIAAAKRIWTGICRFFTTLIGCAINGTKIYFRKKAPRSAAQFSFNIIFSMFPLLICINWLVAKLHTDLSAAIDAVKPVLPSSAVEIVKGYLNYIAEYDNDAALLLGLFMMIMPASAALRSLQGILNDINNRGRKTGLRSFFLSFIFSIVFLVVVYACMILLFTGSWLLNILQQRFDLDSYILDWNWLRFWVFLLLISFMMYILYRFLPFNGKQPRMLFEGKVYPGVLFSSVTLVGVSVIFSYFIGLSSRYSLVYGSLASIIILMLWLYVCSNVIIIGGIVNRLTNDYLRRKRLALQADNGSAAIPGESLSGTRRKTAAKNSKLQRKHTAGKKNIHPSGKK